MNRREFVKRFGIGLSAACALASIPVSAVEALTTVEGAKRIACEYLRKVYNEHSRGAPMNHPRRMEAGRELYEAFEGELVANERFCSGDDPYLTGLMFKGARVECVGAGWTARVVA